MAKALNEALLELTSRYLYEQADEALPEDIKDIYLDAADAVLDILAYWRGYEDD